MRIKNLQPWRTGNSYLHGPHFTMDFEIKGHPGDEMRHYCWMGRSGTLQLNWACPELTPEERAYLTAHLRLLS